MNPVYIRMIVYTIVPLLALVPGIEHNPDAGTLVIDIEAAIVSVPVALAAVAGVFARWGKT